MTSFSAPQSYSITSSDTITLNDTITIDTSAWANISAAVGSSDTITISNGGYSIGAAGSTFTYSSGAGATVGGVTSIGTINNINTFNWTGSEEFVNCLPDFDRIQKMCEQYPGLKIAYEKFKTTYKLVKDHYDTPEDERPRT
jgi:hypothetical protein